MMYQYNNYAYSSGVPQNIAAYSTRQSAAAAAASYNPFMSSSLATSDADHRRLDDNSERDLTSPSCRRSTPGGASCLDRSSADVVPPPPPTTSTPRDRLSSTSARPTPGGVRDGPVPAVFPDGAVYSVPLDRVAVRVDVDDNDDETRHQHTRSHSAPAATRHLAVQRHSGPSPTMWYAQPTSPRPDVHHRMMMSRPLPPPAATPASHDSTTKLRHRRTFPSSDVELNGPVGQRDACDTDARRPNSVNLPPASSASFASSDPMTTRRRLRATRGRPNLSATGDNSFASTLAGMAMIAGVALVFSVVGVQLLLRLTAASRRSATANDDATKTTNNAGDSLLPAATSKSDDSSRTTITRTVVEEVAVALTAATVALSLCCLLTLSIQCFFAIKLLHCPNAESRFFC